MRRRSKALVKSIAFKAEIERFPPFSFVFHFFFVPLPQVFPDGCKQPMLRHESLSAEWGTILEGKY
jgi:hypothetical protein